MYSNDFFFQNTALMAALTGFPNLKNTTSDQLDKLLSGYNRVSKEQIEQHLNEFASKEELERYVHNLAIRNHDIQRWE